jgi:hypothetical protein
MLHCLETLHKTTTSDIIIIIIIIIIIAKDTRSAAPRNNFLTCLLSELWQYLAENTFAMLGILGMF